MNDTPTHQEAAECGLSSHALLTCPFCGGEPTVTDIHSDEIRRKDDEARAKGAIIPGCYVSWKSHFLSIKCHNCGIGFDGTLVDAMGKFTTEDVRNSRERLLTKWNTRFGLAYASHGDGNATTPEIMITTPQLQTQGEPPLGSPSCSLSWSDRVARYHRETGFPESMFIGGDGRCSGMWIMGNDYRVKSTYYGGYPAGYLRRIKALFPDKQNVLHLFSGKVDTSVIPGATVDINPDNAPDYVDDAQTLERVPLEDFDLVLADPPYSIEDAERYQTTMVKRNKVMAALGKRLRPGCHVVWLDQVLPMYRKDEFAIEAVIGMVKSTNHRFRVVTIFCKANATMQATRPGASTDSTENDP